MILINGGGRTFRNPRARQSTAAGRYFPGHKTQQALQSSQVIGRILNPTETEVSPPILPAANTILGRRDQAKNLDDENPCKRLVTVQRMSSGGGFDTQLASSPQPLNP